MVDTRLVEPKWDQDTTQVLVSRLVDRPEAVMVQFKELQEQANQKWDGMQSQLAASGNVTQPCKDNRVESE